MATDYDGVRWDWNYVDPIEPEEMGVRTRVILCVVGAVAVGIALNDTAVSLATGVASTVWQWWFYSRPAARAKRDAFRWRMKPWREYIEAHVERER